MATPMRIKDKKMNKIHLGPSGAMTISTVPAATDAASKASTAQPTNPLSAQEQKGTAAGPQAAATGEATTGSTLQGPELMPTSAGPMEAPEMAETEGPGEETETTLAVATLPPALGEVAPAPMLSQAPAKDPNAQKEATTVAPNTGSGTIVGETQTK